MKTDLLARMRAGEPMTLRQEITMTVQLALPAILAQISSIVMQYIDASMVGRLGADDSASIGLVATSTWLLGGVVSAAITGFTVQVAQCIGAGKEAEARGILGTSFRFELLLALAAAALGALVSPGLPNFLGGSPAINAKASQYFLCFALFLPVSAASNLSGSLLQASGNMRVPAVLHILTCLFDVVYNLLLIFPTRSWNGITIPGAGLGVLGAAMGTGFAHLTCAILMMFFLLIRSPMLHLRKEPRVGKDGPRIRTALKISIPIALESLIANGAQLTSTKIVAPLGSVSIAANSFAVTAESLCYMPGFGISSAATTLIGQATGAGRPKLSRRLGWVSVFLGMAVMSVGGILLYFGSPFMLRILSPDEEIVALGARVLRIEALAEPLYAAAIVTNGVFRGRSDTLIPSLMNLGTMWLVRIPIAAILAPKVGLSGVWIAMAIELSVRGSLFIIRLIVKSRAPVPTEAG